MRPSLAAICSILVLSLPACGQLSPDERRGSQIYMRGTSPSNKEIIALLDNGRTPAPAALMTCANCHGVDGRGKPEGGVVPPDITWDSLTKPYGVFQPNGRSHAPYTESTLKRAFTMGIDPSGNKLDAVMPRFQLSYEDAVSLVAFMKKLGRLTDPGITDASIRIGVVLPPADRLPAMNRLVRSALVAYFERLNHDGGVYGRTVELVFLDLPANGEDRASTFRSWLEKESIFALTGSYLAEAETELAPVLNEVATPLICAFTLEPDLRSPLNPYVFYLNAGLRGEVDQLIDLARKRDPAGARAVLAIAPYETTRRLGKVAEKLLSEAGWNVTAISPDAPGCKGAARVFWLSPSSSAAALRQCAGLTDKGAEFFIPGAFASKDLLDLPETLDGRVFVTTPPGEAEDAGDAALASARLLTLALQRAGRNLTRQTLVDALEGVYKIDVGGMEVSYGPNRRVGASATAPYVLDLRAHRWVAVPTGR
jgi:Periplasmic binding protein/Cytochrome c